MIYIIKKAINFPITHDEAGTIFQYVDFKEYTILNIMFWYHPLGNNHILNTLLTKLSIYVFGMKIWSLRLPNILSFILFFYYSYKICTHNIKNSWLQIAALFILCCHPFLLDFFALCRGYGMSVAFFMAACYYLIEYIKFKSFKSQFLSLVFCILAAYANFTMINVFICVYGMFIVFNLNEIFVHHLDKKKNIFLSTFLLIGFFSLIIIPIMNLKKAGEFKWGGADSFLNSTFYNILFNDLYDQWYFGKDTLKIISILLLVMLISAFLFQLIQLIISRKVFFKAHFTVTILLIFCIVSSILQHQLLGSAYLTNRTAIQFIPLLFLPVALSFHFLNNIPKSIVITLSIFICLYTFYHVNKTYNTLSPKEWWYELHNKQVIAAIEKENIGRKTKVKLGCFWHFAPSINIYITRFGHDKIEYIPPYEELRTNTDFDYYYIYYSDTAKLNKAYKKHIGYSNMVLMKKEN